jgi:hypothetical protein
MRQLCARCGRPAESVNYETDSTYWGAVRKEITTTVERRVRVLGRDWNPRTHQLFTVDEQKLLCLNCWTDFISVFMREPEEGR